MANLTGQQICSTYGRLLQIDGGQLQDGLGNPITSLGNFSASYATSASYIDVTGSGVLVNWNGSQLQLTASSAAGAAVVSQLPPASPNQGDLWWDSDDANMYVWYNDGTGSQWVAATSLAIQSVTADNAISASYAVTASYVLGSISSASYSATASNYFMSDYLVRQFADDTAAAAGGIPLGGIYRTGNVVVVRVA
jgi:hypothetical protein